MGKLLLMDFKGKHLMLAIETDFNLQATAKVEDIMVKAVRATGATILKTSQYKFKPQGYSLVILIAESHASIHTYPECGNSKNGCGGKAFIDYFTCGNIAPRKFREYILKHLKIKHIKIIEDNLVERPFIAEKLIMPKGRYIAEFVKPLQKKDKKTIFKKTILKKW